jgi:hypothetical protein
MLVKSRCKELHSGGYGEKKGRRKERRKGWWWADVGD